MAAGKGIRLRSVANKIPKCMIPICDKPILKWQVDLLKKCKITDITIVTGNLAKKIKIDDVSYVKNKFYRSTEQNYSIFTARSKIKGSVIIAFADIIYDEKILKKLINFNGECGIVVRKDWKKAYRNRKLHPVSEADNVLLNGKKVVKIKKNIVHHSVNEKVVEFLGLVKFSSKGSSLFLKKLKYLNKHHEGKFHTANSFKKAYLIDMIQELINSEIVVSPVFVNGKYFEVDTPEDVKNVERSIKKF